jgi:tetratricopeptide (TPR) repeat protein
MRELPEGDCWLSCPAAGLSRRVRVRAGLLGARLDLRLPAVRRVSLEWREGRRSGELVLDETVPHPLRAGSRLVALSRGALSIGDQVRKALDGLRAGDSLEAGDLKLTVRRVEERPWLPLGLRRSPPPAGALGHLTLLSHQGELVRLASGPRALVVAGACEQLRVELLDELEALAISHQGAGLRVLSILTEPCPGRSSAAQVLLGGAEALWALGTRPGELAVLDSAGRTLRRLASPEEARVYLSRTWAPFAAASRVSVAPSSTVVEAEAGRLLAQARLKQKAGKHEEAHQLLDEVLALSPDLAEARKERALTKARLGDLSGALSEVTWWRSSFGAESAEDLLEEVQRTARVSTLR